MLKLLLLGLLAQTPTPLPEPGLTPGTNTHATAWLNFSGCGSPNNGDTPGKGLPITVTRASNETCQCADSTWRTTGNNQLCDADMGAWIGPVGQNTIANSENMTAGGWIANGATITHQSAQCPMAPDGSARMELVSVPSDNNGPYTSGSHTGGNPVANSAWVSLKTGDSACTLTVGDAYDITKSVRPSLTAIPVRYTAAGTSAQTSSGLQMWRQAGDTCTNFCAWGAQNETNSPLVSPYYKTTGTAVSWPATVATQPLAIAGATKFSVSVTAISDAWDVAFGGCLWTSGYQFSTGESWISYGARTLTFTNRDSGQNGKGWQTTGAPLTVGPHVIRLDYDAAGPTVVFTVDGVVAPVGAPLGAGTGITPGIVGPLTVGSCNPTTSYANARISRIVQCAGPGGCL